MVEGAEFSACGFLCLLSQSPNLLCWVLGILSYSNSVSAAHFEHHFLAVFMSIAHKAKLQGIVLMM